MPLNGSALRAQVCTNVVCPMLCPSIRDVLVTPLFSHEEMRKCRRPEKYAVAFKPRLAVLSMMNIFLHHAFISREFCKWHTVYLVSSSSLRTRISSSLTSWGGSCCRDWEQTHRMAQTGSLKTTHPYQTAKRNLARRPPLHFPFASIIPLRLPRTRLTLPIVTRCSEHAMSLSRIVLVVPASRSLRLMISTNGIRFESCICCVFDKWDLISKPL